MNASKVSAYRERIATLQKQRQMPAQIAQQYECYAQACALTRAAQLDPAIFYEYAAFAQQQTNSRLAIQSTLEYLACYDALAPSTQITPHEIAANRARGYLLLGEAYTDTLQLEQAAHYTHLALAFYQTQYGKLPEQYHTQLAASYHSLAILNNLLAQEATAEDYYQKAIALREAFCANSPDVIYPRLAVSYHNLAAIYENNAQLSKAEHCYDKAIAIQKEQCKTHPKVEKLQAEHASSCLGLAGLYLTTHRQDEAYNLFIRATLTLKNLYDKNPEAYARTLLDGYEAFAFFFASKGDVKQCQDVMLRLIPLARQLYQKDPAVYYLPLANSYLNLSSVYHIQNQTAQAEEALVCALACAPFSMPQTETPPTT